MPVSDILSLQTANLSPQQIANLALQADQDARRSAAAGDIRAAERYSREADALAKLFRETGNADV